MLALGERFQKLVDDYVVTYISSRHLQYPRKRTYTIMTFIPPHPSHHVEMLCGCPYDGFPNFLPQLQSSSRRWLRVLHWDECLMKIYSFDLCETPGYRYCIVRLMVPSTGHLILKTHLQHIRCFPIGSFWIVHVPLNSKAWTHRPCLHAIVDHA